LEHGASRRPVRRCRRSVGGMAPTSAQRVSMFERELRQATSDLTRTGSSFALVGGLAVSSRAEPRLTRDADLAVAVDNDAHAEQIVLSMQQLGYRVLAVVEQDATERMATVRLVSETSAITDLLFASSGIEAEIVARATSIVVVPGLTLPVASVGDLIAMKLLARDDRGRPTDADDLRALRIVAVDHDWSVAERAVRDIESRGYSRGRNLTEALRILRVDGAYPS
jgi:Nucleotidyl transferase AbiEii toxin, Type IV TA system